MHEGALFARTLDRKPAGVVEIAIPPSGTAVIAFLRIFYQGYGPPSRIVLSTAYLIPMLWLQLSVFGRPQVQFRRPVLYIALYTSSGRILGWYCQIKLAVADATAVETELPVKGIMLPPTA